MKIIQMAAVNMLKTVYWDDEGDIHRLDSVLALVEEEKDGKSNRKIIPLFWDDESNSFEESFTIAGYLGLEFNGQAKNWNEKISKKLGEREFLRPQEPEE